MSQLPLHPLLADESSGEGAHMHVVARCLVRSCSVNPKSRALNPMPAWQVRSGQRQVRSGQLFVPQRGISMAHGTSQASCLSLCIKDPAKLLHQRSAINVSPGLPAYQHQLGLGAICKRIVQKSERHMAGTSTLELEEGVLPSFMHNICDTNLSFPVESWAPPETQCLHSSCHSACLCCGGRDQSGSSVLHAFKCTFSPQVLRQSV